MRIVILITVILVMLPLSADCQSEKVCVDRYILERVANKLDSFDVSKKLQEQCLRFRDSCLSLTKIQDQVITNQDFFIGNQKNQIDKLMKVNDEYMKHLQKEKKRLKTKYTISLVGGGVLTVGLTTALLISLLQ